MEFLTNVIDMEMIKITVGLLLFMLANVVLGSVNSMFDKSFNTKKFFSGVGKALVILGVYVVVYIAGAINKDVLVTTIGEVEANVTTALYLVAFSGYIFYAKQLVEKLSTLLGTSKKQ